MSILMSQVWKRTKTVFGKNCIDYSNDEKNSVDSDSHNNNNSNSNNDEEDTTTINKNKKHKNLIENDDDEYDDDRDEMVNYIHVYFLLSLLDASYL